MKCYYIALHICPDIAGMRRFLNALRKDRSTSAEFSDTMKLLKL